MRVYHFDSIRASLVSVLCSIAVGGILSSCVKAQTERFSSSPAYRAMLEELHHDPVRPSHMSAGTLLTSPAQSVRVQRSETSSGSTTNAGLLQLRISKGSLLVELANQETGLTWRMQFAVTRGMQVDLTTAVLSPGIIRLSISAPQANKESCCLHLSANGAGPFFGLGERFDRSNLDGVQTNLVPTDLLGKPGHNWTYIPVPFLFSPHGLGVYFDTATESNFDLTQADRQRFSVELQSSSCDIYFFAGDPKKILEEYTSLTGRPPVPPVWAFGTWICAYQSPQRVLDEARRLKENHIPATAIWTFDVMGKGDIMGWPLWWTGYYPQISKFTSQLHDMGYKALTYVHPYLRSMLDPYNLPNQSYEEGVRNGLFVLNSQGLPSGPGFEQYRDGNIDFTKAENVDWWEQKVREILLTDNFDGWMEDFGEWVNETDRFAAGVTGRVMANLNPLFYHKITYEISHRAKPDAVAFVRSGYAGSQGYTQVVWGGDQFPTWDRDYGLPSVVNAGMTAGLSGFTTWAPDIAANGHSVELWTRWVEFGALTPIRRNHVWDKPEGSVNIWYSRETIDLFRRYARLHATLLAYFQSYAQEASRTGWPILRHLILEFPNDPNASNCSFEYMLGEKILVAPVVEQGASNRTLYLPQGAWVNYWTHEILQGGRDITVSAPLERIPIFVRAGSMLPFTDPDNDVLKWQVFPAAAESRSTFTLYDGTTADVTKDSLRTEVRITRSPVSKQMVVVIPAARRPRQVKLGGEKLAEITAAEGGHGKAGWNADENGRTIQVMVQSRDFNLSVME